MIGNVARSAKSGIALILMGCALIVGCSRMTPDMEVRSRLLKVAARPTMDCGRAITTRDEYAAATACAKDALSRGMPFVVQYRFAEIDIGGERGIATNGKGQAFEIYYLESREGSTFRRYTCTERQLTVHLDGSLGCPD
jgi:hypothetical protein